MQQHLFIPLNPGVLCLELACICYSSVWLATFLPSSENCTLPTKHKSVMVGLVISNMLVLAILTIFTWCAWDRAGKDWLKLKKYQENVLQNSGRLDRSVVIFTSVSR